MYVNFDMFIRTFTYVWAQNVFKYSIQTLGNLLLLSILSPNFHYQVHREYSQTKLLDIKLILWSTTADLEDLRG